MAALWAGENAIALVGIRTSIVGFCARHPALLMNNRNGYKLAIAR